MSSDCSMNWRRSSSVSHSNLVGFSIWWPTWVLIVEHGMVSGNCQDELTAVPLGRSICRTSPQSSSMSTPLHTVRQRILVADDDETTRLAITGMLKSAGYEVRMARDGTEAARKIQDSKFDLVFMDIWMPGASGLEVLAKVRQTGSQPKVIIMTSDGTPQNLLRAVREQAYEFVNKPFPPNQAIELAERALSRSEE